MSCSGILPRAPWQEPRPQQYGAMQEDGSILIVQKATFDLMVQRSREQFASGFVLLLKIDKRRTVVFAHPNYVRLIQP